MKPVIAVLIAIVVLGGGWWYYSTQMMPASDSASATTTPDTTTNANGTSDTSANTSGQGSTTVNINIDASASAAPMTATVTLNSSGFSPKSVTVKKGGTVTWTNGGSGSMWVGSASHPTHTAYSGTTLQEHCADGDNDSFDQCENGTTYSFTFDKVGTWNYHNHSNSSQFGSVVVAE
ncbi:hypothetical protein H7X87_01530 [Acetobacteraceae bacterium]|nr:hypothetical protein [Candidatus Parcubacteria bacterium]